MMREARFDAVFVGIETPELDALKAMRKGLASDTPETEKHLTDFVNNSQIPMLTMILLQARPKTALWERLAKDGRLVEDAARESNVDFLRPYDEAARHAGRCAPDALQPEAWLDAHRQSAGPRRLAGRLPPTVLAHGVAGHKTRAD
jgi:hopanoid C-2 methylase